MGAEDREVRVLVTVDGGNRHEDPGGTGSGMSSRDATPALETTVRDSGMRELSMEVPAFGPWIGTGKTHGNEDHAIVRTDEYSAAVEE